MARGDFRGCDRCFIARVGEMDTTSQRCVRGWHRRGRSIRHPRRADGRPALRDREAGDAAAHTQNESARCAAGHLKDARDASNSALSSFHVIAGTSGDTIRNSPPQRGHGCSRNFPRGGCTDLATDRLTLPLAKQLVPGRVGTLSCVRCPRIPPGSQQCGESDCSAAARSRREGQTAFYSKTSAGWHAHESVHSKLRVTHYYPTLACMSDHGA